MRSLIFQLFAIISIQALENPIPSMLLQPRSFYPHPYQEEAKRFLIAVSDHEDLGLEQKFYHLAEQFRNTGPVRFPDNPDLYAQQQLQQQQQSRVVSHIINKQAIETPQYQKISSARRPKKMRIVARDEYEVPRILAALSNHARRVQNNEFQQQMYTPSSIHTPPSAVPSSRPQPVTTSLPTQQHYLNRIDDSRRQHQHEDHETSPTNVEKKQYKFAYAVKDRHSGDDFSHTQKQENGSVKGSYKVLLPDGRIQITKYVADDSGYHADVTYENDIKTYEQEQPIAPETVQIQPQQQVYYSQNNNVRYTVTPTPYLNSEYNHVRAPTIRSKSYPSTTSIPNVYY